MPGPRRFRLGGFTSDDHDLLMRLSWFVDDHTVGGPELSRLAFVQKVVSAAPGQLIHFEAELVSGDPSVAVTCLVLGTSFGLYLLAKATTCGQRTCIVEYRVPTGI
ncbi:MAG TPA: hypothetical protein VLF67_02495 [Candidatus Saccharimonas sp.]|nr:hypothetical protein [Candidatus Saccharimonas sp.]